MIKIALALCSPALNMTAYEITRSLGTYVRKGGASVKGDFMEVLEMKPLLFGNVQEFFIDDMY